MKKIFVIVLLALMSCSSDDDDGDLARYDCLKGETIGKIRSSGGGLAVSLEDPIPLSVTWQGHANVVELLNIPVDFRKEGDEFYFSAREASEAERGPITADGDETIELILYGQKFDDSSCPD
ncbi:hypothetical protein C900_01406 [Fulvivirga imtechensis AK7]|uniref:Uncharacterized protein n=1 Tax=Fulvivirga imtechensis AK7 TaxID=1237149 RepID=L8JXM6_9BACT|nr:hypothetical protein [Fulvivirga imtechensis]ELR73796.1 hypothetical protein C900_01406 [Fulvivirga imtechensis AK7]